MNRRNFLLGVAATTSVSGGLAAGASAEPTICFFSKNLPNLGYDELGWTLTDAGFSGVDLTVRKGGHVLPERVREDLPRTAKASRSHRLQVQKALTHLARKYGIVAGFHNHPRNVGLAFCDRHEIVRELDPKWIGYYYYYDANNATEEGAIKGWEVGLRLSSPRLKMAACKDFYWEKSVGQSRPVECPLGEGVVNWPAIFEVFAGASFKGPISIHQEYNPPDRMAAAHKDLEFVKKQLATARSV